jgi:hypothetical protein
MDTPVLSSTLFLTVLLFIGLFFFLRASVKDRTQTAIWTLSATPEVVLEEITQYLEGRAYRLQSVDRATDEARFQGTVEASWGLAIFLSLLAGVAGACFGLVLAMQLPQVGLWGLGAMAIAPVAGWFYRQKAQRLEQVTLTVRGDLGGESPASAQTQDAKTRVRVTAHRDELESLRTALNYPFSEE